MTRETHGARVLPYQDALKLATRMIEFGYVDLVFCEDFVISARTLKTGSDGWRKGAELEFIGVVRWYCSLHDVEFVLQTPADAKGFSTDEKLARYGWWTKGLDHSRDASRHLMLGLVNKKVIDPADLLRPRA